MRQRTVEITVGIFLLAAIVALLVLAFKVSGLTALTDTPSYKVTAEFNAIGGLKVRAPVSIAGVKVGDVDSIVLDPNTFQAKVTMDIYNTVKVPQGSSAGILTAGLLGANYIGITPGFSEENVKPGGSITKTSSAIVLENLIGKFLLKPKGGDKK